MFKIEKLFRFEAAHQLLPGCFTSACSDCIHGHSYKVTIVLESRELDSHGMVLDFGVLREIIDEIKAKYDHGVLLPHTLAVSFKAAVESGCGLRGTQKKIVDFGVNPTAENIAWAIATLVNGFLVNIVTGARLVRIKVQETETGSAEWSVL